MIVLTHDVAFLMLLEKAAREQQLSDVGFRCVAPWFGPCRLLHK